MSAKTLLFQRGGGSADIHAQRVRREVAGRLKAAVGGGRTEKGPTGQAKKPLLFKRLRIGGAACPNGQGLARPSRHDGGSLRRLGPHPAPVRSYPCPAAQSKRGVHAALPVDFRGAAKAPRAGDALGGAG